MSNNNFKEEINKKSRKINNIDNLENEICRLKLRIKTLETDWENNNYKLKENFGDIFLHSLFTRLKQSNQVWVKVVQMFLQHPLFQKFFNTIRNRFVAKWENFFSKKQ